MMQQIDSCQSAPWPQDDVLAALRAVFRDTSKEVERLRNAEEAA